MANLTAWETAQARLGLEATQQTETETLIAVASKRCEQHTKRTLAASDLTLYLDGDYSQRLDLRQWPVNSVTSVHVDNEMEFGAGTEVTNYKIVSDRGVLFKINRWPSGYANIKVVANFGYSPATYDGDGDVVTASTVPDDLEESVIQLVSYWLDSPQISWMTPQAGGDAPSLQTNYTGVMDIPFQIRSVWDQYRRIDT